MNTSFAHVEVTLETGAVLKDRLRDVWSVFPAWLEGAPFAVAWEITRIAVHCRVDLTDVNTTYSRTWVSHRGQRHWSPNTSFCSKVEFAKPRLQLCLRELTE